jgi:hypothetical protein
MSRIGKIVLPTATTTISGQAVTYADTTQLQTLLNKIATQLDTLTAGQVSAVWNAANAPPTAVGSATTNPTSKILGVTYGVGDFLRNKTPVVFARSGVNYITLGWMCTVAGNAGTPNPPTFVTVDVPVNL